jgi:excisionase family DNA binding protein
MSQQLHSIEEVAKLLGLHVRTVRNYVREGRLKAIRIGKLFWLERVVV